MVRGFVEGGDGLARASQEWCKNTIWDKTSEVIKSKSCWRIIPRQRGEVGEGVRLSRVRWSISTSWSVLEATLQEAGVDTSSGLRRKCSRSEQSIRTINKIIDSLEWPIALKCVGYLINMLRLTVPSFPLCSVIRSDPRRMLPEWMSTSCSSAVPNLFATHLFNYTQGASIHTHTVLLVSLTCPRQLQL